jgi:hypothetical protein
LTTVLELLSGLEKPLVEPGIFCAPDLLYWAEVARFSFHLVITQKYIPSLEDHTPVWRPVLLGEDRQRFEAISRSMPASCRAFWVSRGKRADNARKPDAMQPRALVWKFVERTVNSVIARSQLSTLPQSSKILQDAWLRGLAAGAMEPSLSRFPEAAVMQFRESLYRWAAPLLRRTSFDYRLAFRLEDPTAKKDYWQIRYFLQN